MLKLALSLLLFAAPSFAAPIQSGSVGGGSSTAFDPTGVAYTTATVRKVGDTMTGALVVTNSSITTTGPLGNIVSGASVTASAFFGDGSQLSNLPAGTVGNTTASSSWTIRGGSLSLGPGPGGIVISSGANSEVIVSSMRFTGSGIQWANGSFSSSSNRVSITTRTAWPEYNTTNTNPNICVPGTTVTFNSCGGPGIFLATVMYNCNAGSGQCGDSLDSSFLIDGANLPGWTGAQQHYSIREGVGQEEEGQDNSYGFTSWMPALSPGPHTACLTFSMELAGDGITINPSGRGPGSIVILNTCP